MALARIRQEDEEEEARRRRRYPKPAPPPEALAIQPGPPPRGGGGRRYFRCRCLDDSIIEVEEGERCPPGCNPITQEAETSIAPLLFGLGFFGLLAFMIAKRPFG